MRSIVHSLLAISASIFCAHGEERTGVALENGVSPSKKYEVVLEADKGSPRFERYEFKGDNDQYPAFLILEVASGEILTRLPWGSDSSDWPSLREGSKVSWNPAGDSVILNTSSRFYSASSIWSFEVKSGVFKETGLPDYKTLTGFNAPKSDDLRPRVGASSSWNERGDLVHEIILSPLVDPKNGDPMHHRITLRMGPKGWTVVSREKLHGN